MQNSSTSSSPSNTKMTRQCWCLRIWAWSPKVEAQILPQSWQGTAVLGFGTLFFLADLLSSRLCSRLLSKCFVPLRIAALQADRSWAKACHSWLGCCRPWGSISARLCTASSARLGAVYQLRAQHGTVVLGVCCRPCEWHVLTSEAEPGSTWLQCQWAQPKILIILLANLVLSMRNTSLL